MTVLKSHCIKIVAEPQMAMKRWHVNNAIIKFEYSYKMNPPNHPWAAIM